MPGHDLPPELLAKIIQEASTEFNAIDTSTFERNRNLCTFSLVSSEWRDIAQRELGREVTVGTRRCLRALAGRARGDPSFAERVQHLRFAPQGLHSECLEMELDMALSSANVKLSSLSLLFGNFTQLVGFQCDSIQIGAGLFPDARPRLADPLGLQEDRHSRPRI